MPEPYALTRIFIKGPGMRRALTGGVVAGLIACGPIAPLWGAAKFNRKVDVGDPAPVWKSLAGVDGKRHSLADEARARLVVVVFICNHCPTARQYDERLKNFVKSYTGKGVRLVAISSSRFPADRFEKMKQHAKKRGFNFPYLHDPTQAVGRQYGVTHTPQVFVLDKQRRIAYMGAIDDNAEPGKVEEHYLTDAVDALLAGKEPEVTESRQFGCELEYKK